ncbi:HesA/moeB/thiF family protein [Tieghemostelium lacteum]|uniref:HesA/moeB/thiF family protein n=1 Tax=Tieghemostelium lacteum TaxID=361077 RepID=A0A151Z4D9_TIELA|nr:HesA/moeB/thiF family protein [Tieghemostelium lacteum]|eukprot:KYQ88811.1 HesA/moeB/thiF family protein [Tieghemostelium lacteum]
MDNSKLLIAGISACVGAAIGSYIASSKKENTTTSNKTNTTITNTNTFKQENSDIDSMLKDEIFLEQMNRTILYYGEEGFKTIRDAFIIVVGLGGVGGAAAHALLRSGVKKLRLIDPDLVTLSSLNRNVLAERKDVGRSKVETMKTYFESICPEVEIEAIQTFFNGDLAEKLLSGSPTYVVDCIDNTETKVALLTYCHRNNIPVISSMGAGSSSDPTKINISDISFTFGCRFGREIRRLLKVNGITQGILCVYSTEAHRKKLIPLTDEEKKLLDQQAVKPTLRVRTLGVSMPIPSIFGLTMSCAVLNALAGLPTVTEEEKRAPPPMIEYSRLLKLLIKKEQTVYRTPPSVLKKLFTMVDIRYLADEVYNSQSGISNAHSTQSSMIVLRWRPELPISLNNLVYLSQKEGEIHETVKNVDQHYPAEIVKKIDQILSTVIIGNRNNGVRLNNFFIVNEISKYLYSNIEILNFIRTCKYSYKFRNQLKYFDFPSSHCYNAHDIQKFNLPLNFHSISLNVHQYKLLIDCGLITQLSTPIVYLDYDIKVLRKQLPKSIQFLEMEGVEGTIGKGVLKEGLKSLYLASNFKTNLGNPGIFPSSLTSISLGYCYNKPIPNGLLPPFLKTLYLGPQYNYPLPTDLPKTLEILEIGKYPLKPGDIPPSIKHLIIGGRLSVINPGDLPSTLKRLDIYTGRCNVQLKVGSIPNSVERIDFISYSNYSEYSQVIKVGIIPDSVKQMHLHLGSNHIIEPNALPNSIHTVILNLLPNSNIPKLPNSIKNLTVHCELFRTDFVPDSLKNLTVYYERDIRQNGELPDSIENLIIETDTEFMAILTPNLFPKQLKSLTIQGGEIQMFISPKILPDSLQSLSLTNLNGNLNQLKNLPKQLESLILTNQKIELPPTFFNFLPSSIKYLKINNVRVQSIKHSTYLKFISDKFNNISLMYYLFLVIYTISIILISRLIKIKLDNV